MAFYLSVSNLAQLVTQVGKGYSQGQRALEHSVFVIANSRKSQARSFVSLQFKRNLYCLQKHPCVRFTDHGKINLQHKFLHFVNIATKRDEVKSCKIFS